MSSQLNTPVQTQMAVGVLKNLFSGEHHGSPRMAGKQSAGRRRVFVQTETGFVLGMELDRIDNAHTVKRKLQLALNVPTEESSLTFGDRVLNSDLSAIPKDSPLLLTRKNIHRSSSTPCLSPRVKDIKQQDESGSIEVLGRWNCFDSTQQMVRDIVKAIKHGVDPQPAQGGLGGAYYFKNVRGDCVAIVKPTDEEPFAPNNPKGFVGKALGQPGLKRSVRVGETAIREVAAYLLDDGHFANVPTTALVKITHSIFNINDGVSTTKTHKKKLVSKIASLQQFVPHDFDASEHGTSSFPVSAVHRIGILDIRILNTDRHSGNLLVRKLDGVGRFGQVELIPIDHGLCLPESLEDPYFEWIHWPQASIPFTEDELEYIMNLDPDRDCEMLRKELPIIREACLRVLVVCTIFLKEAAGYGLCLAEIGEMMTREFRSADEQPSELEVVCLEAQRLIEVEREQLSPRSLPGEDDTQFNIECDELNWGDLLTKSMRNGNGRNPLETLEEEEGEEDSEGEETSDGFNCFPPLSKIMPVSNLSMSLKTTTLQDKTKKFHVNKAENRYTSSGHRSANEQLPVSANFVKVADMGKDEWAVFREKFEELLAPAFARGKTVITGQRQRHRLGTSCQF